MTELGRSYHLNLSCLVLLNGLLLLRSDYDRSVGRIRVNSTVSLSVVLIQFSFGAESFAACRARVRMIASVHPKREKQNKILIQKSTEGCSCREAHLQSHVGDQCPLLQELFAANGAGMRNTSMYPTVIDQLELSRKRGPTVAANERIDRSVEPRVHNQMVFLGKTLAALFANVWPFAGMEFAVRHQMPFQWERSAALLAHERTLPAVHTRMGQQMVLQREALLAFTALIRTVR